MKKGIQLVCLGVLASSSLYPTSQAFASENSEIGDGKSLNSDVAIELVEQNEITNNSTEDSSVEQQLDENQEIDNENISTENSNDEGIDENQIDESISDVENSPSEFQEATLSDKVEDDSNQAPQTRAISPELGIEIPDYDGKLIDKENVITDTENAKVSHEYAFMPQITDKTEVVVEGNYSVINGNYKFDLKENNKGAISITYKNVGTYNGKVIDLKVSFTDWTFMKVFNNPNYTPFIRLSSKSTGIYMYGLADVEANYFFLNNITGLETKISGFFNFTDIDNNQYLDIYKNANIKNIYATKDNVLYYKDNGTYLTVGDYYGKDADNNLNESKYWLTYTYDKTSNFTIVYNEPRGNLGYYVAIFDYTYQAPVVIEQSKNESKDENNSDTILTNMNLEVQNNHGGNKTASLSEVNGTSIPETSKVLPYTGEIDSSLLTIIGSMTLIASGAYVLNLKRKKNN